MFRSICMFALGFATALSVQTSLAETDSVGHTLYVKHKCYECHRPAEHHIGPSLQTISARYATEADRDKLVIRLSIKIIEGGYGNWGVVPMNTNPDVTPEEAAELSRWILGIVALN